MMEITDDSINRIGELLLPDGATFNDERKEVISTLDKSVDVSACPGSGKTTTLLAKLLLLEEKMPFKDGKGLCVLTHTNVAIEELKFKAGQQAGNLFSYPNFFGTFQKFVNKFLAIPAFIHLKGHRPNRIDKERHDEIIQDIRYVPGQDKRIADKAFHYLLTYRNREKLTLGVQNDSFFVTDKIDGQPLSIKKPRAKQKGDWSNDLKESIRNWLVDFKKIVLFNYGVMSFKDAYSIALMYLRGTFINRALSERFKFVFIDEMQDTYTYQEKIINEAFDDSVIIQKFGDPNQSIYNKVSVKNVWEPNKGALPISSSKRFGEEITNILRTVCIEPNKDLKGNQETSSFPPHIIVYNNNIEGPEVLERYVKLIATLGVDEIAKKHNRPIKAIGWVGPKPEETEKHTIKTYFESYNRTANINKSILPTVKSHLRRYDSSRASQYFESLLNCFLRILQLADIKRDTENGTRSFTKNTLQATVKEKDEDFYLNFRTNISKWISGIIGSPDSYSEEVLESIRNYIKENFLPFFDIELNEELREFIDSNRVARDFSEDNLVDENIFNHSSDDLSHIDVEVGTIHSAKGETHTATFYLETDYQGDRESNKIMDQLIGIPYEQPKHKKDTYTKEALKMAYVGMSRPTHLLCLAGKEQNIMPNKDALEDNGWIVIDDLIN